MSAVPIAASTFGQVLFCPGCRIFHLEFGNLHLSMYIEHLYEMWEILQDMNPAFYEHANRSTPLRRKILIPLKSKNVNTVFTAEEILDLRGLLGRAIDRAVMPDENARHVEPHTVAKG